jgi:hypothetical protein
MHVPTCILAPRVTVLHHPSAKAKARARVRRANAPIPTRPLAPGLDPQTGKPAKSLHRLDLADSVTSASTATREPPAPPPPERIDPPRGGDPGIRSTPLQPSLQRFSSQPPCPALEVLS